MAERLTGTNLIDEYSAKVLGRIDTASRAGHIEVLRPALETVIYGPIVERYVRAAVDLENYGDGLSAGKVDDKVVASAIDLLAEASVNSEIQYGLQHPGTLGKPEFRQAMASLHRSVVAGEIELVSEEFAMTPNEGRLQVEFADEAFTQRDPRVQTYLAGLNYATFTGKTMRTGRDFIEGSHTDLKYWTERDLQEGMPHLVLAGTL